MEKPSEMMFELERRANANLERWKKQGARLEGAIFCVLVLAVIIASAWRV